MVEIGTELQIKYILIQHLKKERWENLLINRGNAKNKTNRQKKKTKMKFPGLHMTILSDSQSLL